MQPWALDTKVPKSNILSDRSRHDNGLCNVPPIIIIPYIRSWCFIFQGDDGTIGETGIEGDDGAKGAKGDIGAPGLRGPPGQPVSSVYYNMRGCII